MKRRSFLQFLGFGAASVLVPWSIVDDKLKILKGRAKTRAQAEAYKDPSLDYQIITVDSEGTKLYAPRTIGWGRPTDREIMFMADDIAIDRSAILIGTKLLDPRSRVIAEHDYAEPIHVACGDVVKIRYSLRA